MARAEESQDAQIYIVARRQHRGQPARLEKHIPVEPLGEMFGIDPEVILRKCRQSRRPWPHHKHPRRGGMSPVFCEHDIEWITHELQTEADE